MKNLLAHLYSLMFDQDGLLQLTNYFHLLIQLSQIKKRINNSPLFNIWTNESKKNRDDIQNACDV